MSRNRLLVGGLVIVAAIVIAYFAFMYPPVSKEDTSGAIGVAKKYRSEQITDKDVMLKDEEAAAAAAFAMMSPDEKAAMFERTTGDLQARTLAQSPEVTAALIARADDKLLARLFQGMDAKARVDAFERSPQSVQAAVCKSIGVTAERYSQFTLDQKAEKLRKAPDVDLAAIAKQAPIQERMDFVARTEAACRNDLMKLLDRTEKADIMERAPVKIQEEMERSYKEMGRTSQAQE